MHTAAIQGPDSGPVAASTITTGSTANTSTGAANHGSTTAKAGSPNKVSSATKGARYDETAGEIDDRTGMQKLADKLSPGSAVGKHTRYAVLCYVSDEGLRLLTCMLYLYCMANCVSQASGTYTSIQQSSVHSSCVAIHSNLVGPVAQVCIRCMCTKWLQI